MNLFMQDQKDGQKFNWIEYQILTCKYVNHACQLTIHAKDGNGPEECHTMFYMDGFTFKSWSGCVSILNEGCLDSCESKNLTWYTMKQLPSD